jgi:hypothetical protein
LLAVERAQSAISSERPIAILRICWSEKRGVFVERFETTAMLDALIHIPSQIFILSGTEDISSKLHARQVQMAKM